MDEKFMKVLREQQEIQQKAARILHDTEKMKEEVQNKLESLKRKVENDFKNIGEFLKEANVQFATYEYIFQEDAMWLRYGSKLHEELRDHRLQKLLDEEIYCEDESGMQ